ncbi:MAG: DUF1553 domain-containing protein [Planctomycetaceae bacterium]|nr:DUF1553 domain-containing protein [Planctomycetales bacterium]MCB9921220.1 DUF1553 domain-containing protein [Planctomycetaceae bacterium]
MISPDDVSTSQSAPGSLFIALLVTITVGSVSGVFAEDAPNAMELSRFNDAVLPLLKKHCYECHSHEAGTAEGGLVLDSRAGWMIGGDSGPAIIPGQPDASRVFDAVRYSNTELQMPPDGRLPQRDVQVLRDWIARGAFDPRVGGPLPEAGDHQQYARLSDLWSLQPVGNVKPPAIADSTWIRNDIDRFIVAKLSENDVLPNEVADKYALLRRATFDLLGLPPTIEEIEEFVADDSDDAYEQMIERLLDSPHYGERWGRHWLDLARYGDSNGGDINYAHANAWRYRDYVIQAFNDDKPYDDFIREQLAGDLLTDGGNAARRRELLTATGFLMLGPKMLAEVDTDKLLMDIVDEQLDVTGLTFLGMTFGCARCHDHKFDPITTEDYYALAGIFRSTKVIDVLRPSNGVSEWLEIDVTSAETLTQIEQFSQERERLQRLLVDLGATTHSNRPASNAASKAIVVSDLPALRSTTWAAWVRIHSPQNLGGVISASYIGANQGHSLGFDNGNTPRIVWNHGSQPHTIIAAPQPISFGQWHHLALTFNASSEQLRLYVDGHMAAVASNVATTEFSTIGVGRRESSQQFQFVGDVDEVQLFDRALDDEQIQSLSDRHTLPLSPLVHWEFGDIQGRTVVDSADEGLDGRLIGVSARTGVIDDGVEGKAFSFSLFDEDAVPDADRDRRIATLRTQIQQLESAMPARAQVMAVAESTPVDLPVHIRGNHLNLAERSIARSTPRVFDVAMNRVEVPANDNGRLQLAAWIADPSNPLTARVMVNRIWQYHFGEGLVRSSSNFGVRGEYPSHPELLDWLASEFVASGWSIKQMHRLIMNAAAYQRSSDFNAKAVKLDPENRWLARYPIRRLEAEAIRDSLLAVTNELDRTLGGTLLESSNKKRVTMSPDDPVYTSTRRSVYLPAIRIRGFEMFSIFDVSENGQHVAQRPQTMVAQQALFLMNNSLVLRRANCLAYIVSQQPGPFEERTNWLYRVLYGRPATEQETATLELAFDELASSNVSRDGERADLWTWQQIVHTLVCANEFIHIR